jgi:hypothetical protein
MNIELVLCFFFFFKYIYFIYFVFLKGYIIPGLTLGHRMFHFLLLWILGVIYFGFHAIVFNVLPYLPVTIVLW